ncbi:cytochrome P450 [Plantactinospora sp. GCM10030261]|uniref:cytochrome P450 family protein n=1 Tax=Plantactinospora sp. GCM10030261 TaxID=3273420 RepID=UPI00361CF2DC
MTDLTSHADPLHLDDTWLADPHAAYAVLREERPVVPVRLSTGIRAWLVTRHADVRAALADPRLSKDSTRLADLMARQPDADVVAVVGDSLAEHMLNSDPPDHTRLRRLVGRAFTGRAIAGLRPRIQQIADELLAETEARAAGNGGVVDLLDSFAVPLPITVISELLGVPLERRDQFRDWSNTLLSNAAPDVRRPAAVAMAGFLHGLIDAKRRRPADDMLSTIVAATEDADRLSEREAVSMAFLLLVAGHETTVNLIGNGMLALLRHPDQMAALRTDPTLVPRAVEEFLRYDGPVNLATLRYTTEPVTLAGTTIPAEEFVLVSLISANRDPAQHPDPDRLDIRRDAAGHLAFGHGIHYCLGAPLARLEGEIAFGALLARFPDLTLAREPAELTWRPSSLIRGLVELPVRVGGQGGT